MGSKTYCQIYKYFNKFVPPYMAYSQKMAKVFCGRPCRRFLKLKKKD